MTSPAGPVFGAIEGGGTKFVLATGRKASQIDERHEIPTRSPAETLAEAAAWFSDRPPVSAIGIACFGPVELDPASPAWGQITNTPKAAWANCDIAGFFARELGVPVGFDTDVNGAALAEARWGAGQRHSSLAYITVGTGIGGGLVLDGKPVHGAAHPEMGHIFPRRRDLVNDFAGVCPHHGDCLEGLASGPAIKARWGASLSELPLDHPAHDLVAGYLAQLCYSVQAMTACEVIVLGGGVAKTPGLIERVRLQVAELDRGYLPGGAGHLIVRPELGDNAGLTSAMMLAESALVKRD